MTFFNFRYVLWICWFVIATTTTTDPYSFLENYPTVSITGSSPKISSSPIKKSPAVQPSSKDSNNRMNEPNTLDKPSSNHLSAVNRLTLAISRLGNFGSVFFLGWFVATHFKSFIAKILHQNVDNFETTSTLVSVLPVNSTQLIKIEREQEELYTIVHDLYKSQNDKIALLETKFKEFQTSLSLIYETQFKVLKTSLATQEDILKEFQDRFNQIEITSKNLQTNLTTESITAFQLRETVESLQSRLSAVQHDVKQLMNDFQRIEKVDMPKLLKQHDDVVLHKLRLFGDNIKKLVKSASEKRDNRRWSEKMEDE
jgi:hypothetical protein